MLGTLIFEWDEGRKDVIKLVLGGRVNSPSVESFSVLDTKYADKLVDLCVERGFEGWLVNVEVELGFSAASGEVEGTGEHANALLAWVSYLRSATAARIPGGEIIWQGFPSPSFTVTSY
jgi:endo-beta-N-acetylglucosaminidase D